FYKTFTAQDLRSSDWIQSIVQDKRGVIYGGNNTGAILEYDGTTWKAIQATNGPIRSLKRDSTGRIYVGSYGEFGFLEPGPDGAMQYRSLMHLVRDEDKYISDVWSIDIFGKDVYFRSIEKLFRLRDGRIKAFKNPYGWFGNLIILDGHLYVTIDHKGIILRMKEDTLVRFFESPELSSIAFGASADFTPHRELVGSWGGGVFVFTPDNLNKPGKKVLERFSVSEKLLKGAEVYRIEKDMYAAKTDNGVSIFDKNGSELQFISTRNGLNASLVETVYSDRDHYLWIGTEKGITRVAISSPVFSWYSVTETSGTTWGVIPFNGTIYFWSVKGIFSLRDNQAVMIHDEPAGLVTFHEPRGQTGNRLLAISNHSLSEIRNNRLYPLLRFPKPLLYQQIFISRSNPDRIYLFCTNGLYLIRFNKGKWLWDGNVAGITRSIQSLTEDENGNLWLVTDNYKNLIHLKFETDPESSDVKGSVFTERFFRISGSPPVRWIRCLTVGNRVLFGTDRGLFRFDEQTRKFHPEMTLGRQFASGRHGVYILREGPGGVVFVAGQLHHTDDIGLCLPKPGGSYQWYTRPFKSLEPQMRIYDAGFDQDGSLWIANDEGLNKYDPGKDRYVPEKFNTLIRQVSTGKDSVLFRGTYYILRNGIDGDSAVRVPGLLQPDRMIPELSYRFNSMKFSYSAVSYEMEDQNVYQYMLEGFDKEWSNWKPESSKEYSNLQPGDFAFRVRAKNIYGIESDQAVYRFTILPPWYRTIWAYLGYLLVVGLLIRIIVKFNLRRLQARNQVLEESVKERTAEVVRQKEEIVSINQNLLLQQEELKTTLDNLRETQAQLIQSEKMASLGQLMAGIAHEINTPLGAIKASVSEITSDSEHILTRLPGLIRKLDDQQFSMFLALVNRSAGKSFPASSREKRKHKKDLQSILEDQGVTDPGYKADTLVDMGIYGDIGPFTDLLKLDHVD
ncbi:MAG: hypothetical protein EHM46_06860, partial [Bacteroidetes bacterium]